jgi:hypothetical protein
MMPPFKLEPEFAPDYDEWKRAPSPQTTGKLLRSLQPAIDRGISAHVGRQPGPNIRAHARKLTLGALRTYDPGQARLSTHVINHLQGLKRVHRTSNQILRVPERVMLDRNRLFEAENQLEDQYGRPPSLTELADYTGLSAKRIERVRQFRHPVAEGQLAARQGPGGEPEGFAPAVVNPSNAYLELAYQDMGPINQNILDMTLGLHGQPQMSNQDIAKRLRLTPGAISQRKAQIQAQLDRMQEIYQQ